MLTGGLAGEAGRDNRIGSRGDDMMPAVGLDAPVNDFIISPGWKYALPIRGGFVSTGVGSTRAGSTMGLGCVEMSAR
jgi:hypothetical protein